MTGYDVVAPIPVDAESEQQWLAKRMDYIGASEAAAILGLSPWTTPLDVWDAKQPNAQPIPENRHMMWGKRLEPVIAQWLEVDYPEVGRLTMPEGMIVSRDAPFLSATLDREASWADDGFVSGLVEIKNGSTFTRSAWWDPETREPIVPPYYETQAQQQMFVRGVRRGFVGALLGGNELIIREVEYNERFIEILVNELGDWQDRYVVAQTPPPPSPRDVWRFSGRTREEADVTVVADERIAHLVDRRNRLQPRLSAGGKLDDEIKDEIRAFMQDATVLVDGEGKRLVTWYRGADKPYFDVPALKEAHPAIVEEFTRKVPGNRTMTFLKPKK